MKQDDEYILKVALEKEKQKKEADKRLKEAGGVS